MPDEKKLDPFKPIQPNIPGVEPGAAKSPPAKPQPPPAPVAARAVRAPAPPPQSSSPVLVWIAGAVVVLFIVGGALLFWLRAMSHKASQPATEPSAAGTLLPEEPAKPTENLPVGPGPVANAGDLQKTWSGRRFLFRDPVTSEAVPALVVRLPGGSYWAFSLREPFGTCELEYVSDLEKLRSDYNYRADHPMVGNPCNHSVYDLLKYGTSSNGGLVRGEVVQGLGIRPPMAIEVREDGQKIVAVRME